MGRGNYLYMNALALPMMRIIGKAVGREVLSMVNQESAFYQTLSPSISLMPLSYKFQNLATTWKTETRYSPSMRDIVSNSAYLQIIGMGDNAIPLILNEMQINLDHWFVALKAITGADPVKKEDLGNVKAMTNAWIEWGKQYDHQHA